MKIGIDRGYRSKPYVNAAKKLNISYKLIDCTANNAMSKISEVDALIWHFTQDRYIDKRIAASVIKGAEIMGKRVYPNSNTCWMFDDKVAEKYLLQSVGAPIVDSFLFFDEKSALAWLRKQKFPIVYKLPQGAGSQNVRLIHNLEEARKVCKNHFSILRKPEIAMRLYYTEKNAYLRELKSMKDNELLKYSSSNKGYIYFQKFLPGNTYDIRVTIIGKRAIIFRRGIRANDFRASGSGKVFYDVSEEDKTAIPIARKIACKIGAQTMAFDFIYDMSAKKLMITEMSYGFKADAVKNAEGWYDDSMTFHKEETDVHQWVLNHLLYG